MADIFSYFFLNGKKTVIRSENVIFTIDAVVQSNENLTSQITQHPVEKGSFINDHVIHNPQTLSLQCVISDNPLQVGDIEAYGEGERLFNNAAKPSIQARQFFKTLKDNSELLTITTSQTTFENMLLKDIRIPRDVQKSNALFCTLDFQEIILSQAEEVEIVAKEKNKVNKPKKKGKKKPKNLTDTRLKGWDIKILEYITGVSF